MRPNTFSARHAERLILAGPIAEGFVGGLSTFNGAFHAFVLLFSHSNLILPSPILVMLQIARELVQGQK
jgi:hypothetical protein